MAHARIHLRIALPGEFDELVRIDDEACSIFGTIGLAFDFSPDHPFAVAERRRWLEAVRNGHAYVATGGADALLGFAVLGFMDGAPHLEQLSVRPQAMRRGVGTALVERAIAWSENRPLWLTTYGHVAWNAPYYERFGFSRVQEAECGAEVRLALAAQRSVLPAPEQRVAMVRRPR